MWRSYGFDPAKGQELKMLRLLRAKMGDFSCDEVRARTRKIKRKQYDAQLKCKTIGTFHPLLLDIKRSLCYVLFFLKYP